MVITEMNHNCTTKNTRRVEFQRASSITLVFFMEVKQVSDYINTRRDFFGFTNLFGFSVIGFAGVYTKGD